MASRQRHGHQTVSSGLRSHGVPTRKPASTRAFTACRSLQSGKAVLEITGFSYSEFGAEYQRITGGHVSSRQAAYKMLNAKFLSDNVLQVLGQMLSNYLTRICGVDIGINIIQNSPMHIIPYCRCRECGMMFAIDRPDVVNCPKHRKA